MARYFRDDGFGGIASVVSATGAGVILSGQGSNTTTYLLGVNSHSNTTLKESGTLGNVIMNIGAGNFNFPATIALDGSKNIYSTGADAISIFYYIQNN
jgi:hypothetical protein